MKIHHTLKTACVIAVIAGGIPLIMAAPPAVGPTVGISGSTVGQLNGAGAPGTAAIGGGAAFGAPGIRAGASNSSAAGVAVPDLRADGEATETIGMRQARFGTRAANAGGVAASAPGMAHADDHAVAAVAAAGPKPPEFAEARLESRTALVATIDDRLAADAKTMAALKRQSKTLSAEARADFNTAAHQAQTREKMLRQSMKLAAKADADSWPAARSSLEMNYEAYTHAAAEAQAAANAHAAFERGSAATATTIAKPGK